MGRIENAQKMHPLVSIIIPSYNSLHFLDETLKSALNQTYNNLEVILVDDGSTDGTVEHFKRFKENGVVCLSQENSGASVARNTGLEACSGEYIQFLDADDIIHSEKIEKQISRMLKERAELSFTPWNIFLDDINEKGEFKFDGLNYNQVRTGKALMISYGKDNWFIPTVSWLTKRSLIEKVGYWNPFRCPNDDGEFFSRVLFWAEKVVCIDTVLAYYRTTGPESLSVLNSEEKLLSSYRSWKLIQGLLATSSDTRLSGYPKRGFRYLYFNSIKTYPKIAKLIAKEYDKIDQNINKSASKYYSFLVNLLGLHYGHRLAKYFGRIKEFLRI